MTGYPVSGSGFLWKQWDPTKVDKDNKRLMIEERNTDKVQLKMLATKSQDKTKWTKSACKKNKSHVIKRQGNVMTRNKTSGINNITKNTIYSRKPSMWTKYCSYETWTWMSRKYKYLALESWARLNNLTSNWRDNPFKGRWLQCDTSPALEATPSNPTGNSKQSEPWYPVCESSDKFHNGWQDFFSCFVLFCFF